MVESGVRREPPPAASGGAGPSGTLPTETSGVLVLRGQLGPENSWAVTGARGCSDDGDEGGVRDEPLVADRRSYKLGHHFPCLPLPPPPFQNPAKPKTPIIAGVVSGVCVGLAWLIGMILFIRRRKQRRINFARHLAQGTHRVKVPEAYIVPPDPAVIEGQKPPSTTSNIPTSLSRLIY